jgi:hypothetical protein
MDCYRLYLDKICKELTEKFELNLIGQEISILYKENSNVIKSWVIININTSNIIEEYGDLKDLLNTYSK